MKTSTTHSAQPACTGTSADHQPLAPWIRYRHFQASAVFLCALLACLWAPKAAHAEDICAYSILIAPGANLIANHCDHIGVNTLNNVFPIVPAGSQIRKWNPLVQDWSPISTFDGTVWSLNLTLNPGEGASFWNPGPAFTLEMSGIPHTPVLPLSIPHIGHYLISSQVPAVMPIEAITGLAPLDGDGVFYWDAAAQQIGDGYNYIEGLGWVDDSFTTFDPTVKVGEAVFYYRNSNINPPQCISVQIVQPPSNVTVRVSCCTNTTNCATFSVAATGTPPLFYEWFENGLPIPGANAATLTICPVTPAHDGSEFTVRVTNACGDITSGPAKLSIVLDIIPPMLLCPPPLIVGSLDDVPPPNPNAVLGTNQCGNSNLTVVHISDELSGECPTILTRTYLAIDPCGVSNFCTQIIRIHDTTRPTIQCPEDMDVQLPSEVPPPDPSSVLASDNSGIPPTVTFLGEDSSGSCPRVIHRFYVARDSCGNSNSCVQTITVHDTTPPTIHCPEDLVLECPATPPLPDPTSVMATDNSGVPPTVIHLGDVTTGLCPRVIRRAYMAIDECGNTNVCRQLITIRDTTPPVIVGCTNIEVMAKEGDTGAMVDFTVTATDECGGPVTVVCTPGPGFFTIGETPVECIAFDACTNVARCTFIVRVYGHTGAGTSGCCAFTQGYYGNPNGKFNGSPSLAVVGGLLAQGPLTIGVQGIRSLTIGVNQAVELQSRMPSGGKPTLLPNLGDYSLQTILGVYGAKGRFNNVLIGQTITLTLNTRLSDCLLRVGLAPTFCTVGVQSGPDGLRGTADDVLVPSDLQSFAIPDSVRSALVDPALGILDNTVRGLLDLANRALAGLPLGRATIADVNDAVDAINRGFDECRVLVDCASGEVVQDSSNDGFDTRPTLGDDPDPQPGQNAGLLGGGPQSSQTRGQCNLRTRRTNLHATKEQGEPNHGGNAGGRSVWWRWRSPLTGPVTILCDGSSFDTLLSVYTGNNLADLVEIASSDDSDGSLNSQVTFQAVEGIHYQIAVDGYEADSGSIVLTIILNRPRLCLPVTIGNNGQVELCLDGALGCLYTVEGSTDLEHWSPVATVQNTGGTLRFNDPDAVIPGQRFYRVIEDP